MFRLIQRGKIIDTFDLFSEAWCYAKLYVRHYSLIEDMQTKDYWVIEPTILTQGNNDVV